VKIGPLAVAGTAVALARRDGLVLALAGGAALLTLIWVSLDYPPRPQDLDRVAGHARNMALLALALALSARIVGIRSRRWRYATVPVLAVLVIWPTAVAPARSLGNALGHGVHLSNTEWIRPATPDQAETNVSERWRFPGMSRRLAAYIRDHTDVDARVLNGVDERWLHAAANQAVLMNTGRPNNQGFADVVQLELDWGPEYLDARLYLEPSAFERLGLAYVYATDTWVASLPARARDWLADPDHFDLLARDGDAALYRVRPAFLALETEPHPASFEALRAIASGTVVYLPPQPDWRNEVRLLRVASASGQARLVGTVNAEGFHLRTAAPWRVDPLGAQVPDLAATPLLHEAWQFPPASWTQVWRNPPDRVAVYALHEAGKPLSNATLPRASLRLTEARAAGDRFTFTVTLVDRAPDRWSGQDWVLVPTDPSPWAIPVLDRHNGEPVIDQWFAGQMGVGSETTSHTYVFDASASTLAVGGASGALSAVQASERTPSPGVWMLALRLTRWVDRGVQEPAVIIPALRVEVSDSGTVSYQVYDAAKGWRSP